MSCLLTSVSPHFGVRVIFSKDNLNHFTKSPISPSILLFFPCVCVCVCVCVSACVLSCFNSDRLLGPQDSPGKNPGVDCHGLLWGIFPTQGSNPGLPHCKRMIYHLSHKDLTYILCIARWILNYWIIKEVSKMILLAFLFIFFFPFLL